MPTEITRPSAPTAALAKNPGLASHDVTPPLSVTALAIIGILVLILHVAGSAMLDRSQAHPAIAVSDETAKCPADAEPPVSLPFD